MQFLEDSHMYNAYFNCKVQLYSEVYGDLFRNPDKVRYIKFLPFSSPAHFFYVFFSWPPLSKEPSKVERYNIDEERVDETNNLKLHSVQEGCEW